MEDKKRQEKKKTAFSLYKIKSYKAAVLATMLTGVVGVKTVVDRVSDFNKEDVAVNILKGNEDRTRVYVDYLGKAHTDRYGNLAKIEALRPQIMALIYAVEGFSEKAFCDGHQQRKSCKSKKDKKDKKDKKNQDIGTPTIGSGFTVLYDENGDKRMVKKGERMKPSEDAMYNRRYIDMELVPVLGDSVGRSLSNEEILCSIGLGYCWGTNGLKNSEFYKSLKNNDDVEVLGRKISGWRTPIGILKRGYLCEQVLKGCWTAEDLLDLPIYYVEDKGFVFCSIYTLDFRWYMPCEKDKKGEFIKDKKGHDVPKIAEDDYCVKFYADYNKNVLNKLKDAASQSGNQYMTVRNFITEEFLAAIEHRNVHTGNVPNPYLMAQKISKSK